MAGDSNSQNCADIPTIFVGQDAPGSVKSCQGNLFFDAYSAMSEKTAKVLTRDAAGTPDSGSGFFVGDGTHLVTNAHVIENSNQIHVDYLGKSYPAKLEKLDDIGDEAELKIVGLAPDNSRSQDLTPAPLTPGERVEGVGVPGVASETKWFSPGAYLGSNHLFNILNDPTIRDPEAQRMLAAFNSGDPVLKQEAQDRANVVRLITEQGARPGSSGTLVDDTQQRFVGMLTTVNGNNGSLLVPARDVQAFVDSPESKFNFNYDVQTTDKPLSTSALLTDAAGAGVEALGFLGKGRLAPLAFAAVKAGALYNDIHDLATGDGNQNGLGLKTLEDGAMVAGGLAATALWASPVGRIASLGVMGAALAARAVSDLIPEKEPPNFILKSITRQNGDTHAPWQIVVGNG